MNAQWETLADGWMDPNAQQLRFVQGDDFIAVGTARNVTVPVTLSVLKAPPSPSPADADRWHDGTLRVHSGAVEVFSVTAASGSGVQVALANGTYCVRVIWRGKRTVSANGLDGDDSYDLLLWEARD